MLCLPGSLIAGLIVYFVLSNLLVTFWLSVPISIVLSILTFGLTDYYSNNKSKDEEQTKNITSRGQDKHSFKSRNIFFVCFYIFLLTVGFLSKYDNEIFAPWKNFDAIQIIRLGVAIALTFFAPGYALVSSALDGKRELRPIARFLLSYIFSILVTGLTGYITASLGFAVSDINILLNVVYLLILVQFVGFEIRSWKKDVNGLFATFTFKLFYKYIINVCTVSVQDRQKIIVFGSLFSLVILSTFYLYGGVIIGDQWDHHGRSFMFLDGMFRYFAVSGLTTPYPPFFYGLLSSFFTLSSIPSANAYASIDFLNVIPVFAFYYFFTNWAPSRSKKAALLSSALFMLSSGFGWIYVLNLSATTNHITSHASALSDLFIGSIKTFDIWTPNTFIDVGHPDITTGLIIIALPAGFVLLGLLREEINNKLKYIIIFAAVSFLGFLSHDEFGLFVITAISIIILFQLSRKSQFFVAILAALSLVILFSVYSPSDYYRNRELLGLPYLNLYLAFVVAAGILYILSSRILYRLFILRCLLRTIKKMVKEKRLVFGIAIISIVTYLYVLSFIIWGIQLPVLDIRINTNGLQVVPWYFYPLRFGITGILGLCFILSYIFKKFEKEVFVFGIIAIVAFLTGPYYDEHRFSKYIMVSMLAFASLLLYKILDVRKQSLKKPLINGIVIACVISASSLSILMYLSYTMLGLESPNQQFDGLFPRRHFPIYPDINLFRFLHNNVNLQTEDIAIPLDERIPAYQANISKYEAFGGIPLTKLEASPTTLQTTSLEGLYTLLNLTDTKFIVLPKQLTNNSEVLNFASENFRKVYNDDKYIVLMVPPIAPPSSGNTGVVFHRSLDYYNISIISEKTLNFGNNSLIMNDNNIRPPKIQTTRFMNVNLWSKPLLENNNINYIEGVFRIVSENKTDNHAGIIWNDQSGREYYAFLRSDRLVVAQDGREIASSPIDRQLGEWFTLKVVYTQDKINLFVNDILKIQIQKFTNNSYTTISKVGLRSFNCVAEFEPLKIGKTSMPSIRLFNSENSRYKYYYPLSAFALSRIKYDTFVEGDFSAFTKKNVILAFDPVDTTNYLKFVKSGGNIIIVNSDNNFRGGFSKLLHIIPDKQHEFDGIARSKESTVGVSGTAKDIQINNSSNTIINASYLRNGRPVAPFVIEKAYHNGKIIFVNAGGFFKTVSDSPDKFFTLGNIPSLIGLKTESFKKLITSSTLPITRFIGKMDINGRSTLSSTSFLPVNGQDLFSDKIVVSPSASSSSNKFRFNESSVRNLELYGNYRVLINSTDLLYTPAPSLPYSYVRLQIPVGSSITINLFNGSKAEFYVEKNNKQTMITLNSGKIEFTSIRNDLHALTSISVLMKRPQIDLNGTAFFEELRSNNPYQPTRAWANGVPLLVKGNTVLRLEYTDNDNTNESPPRYVTYFKWVHVGNDTNTNLQLTASRGSLLKIPWLDVITSDLNNRAIVSILISAVIAIVLIKWSTSQRMKGLQKNK